MHGNDRSFAMIGMRVVRGPGWSWRDQDSGEGHVGTIVELGGAKNVPKNTVLVLWDGGRISNYRTGLKGIYDLFVLDSTPTGIKHEKYGCAECEVNMIRGTRWRCAQCDRVNLCTKCYMKPAHNTQHRFLRHDTAVSDPVPVEARAHNCTMIQSLGLFVGARVVRGHNWKPEWEDQDGGEGNEGEIVELRGTTSSPAHNNHSVALVKWDTGIQDRYRVGCNGMVDLKCVRPAKGMLYYRSHLPLCGKPNQPSSIVFPPPHQSSSTPHPHGFTPGSRVRFTLPDELLRDLLKGHGEWNPSMKKFRGKIGYVHRITDKGDVRVQFKSDHQDRMEGKPPKFTFHHAALELVEDSGSALSSVDAEIHDFNSHQSGVFSAKKPNYDAPRHQSVTSPPSLETENSVVMQAFRYASVGDVKNFRRCAASCPQALERHHKNLLPIHVAARNGCEDIIRFYVEKGMDLSVLDSSGNTPLHHSVFGKHLNMMKLLLSKRCDVNSKGNDGNTPLHVAAMNGFVEEVALLLEFGADVNIQNTIGNTALLTSIAHDKDDIAEVLCSNPNLNYNLPNKHKMTCLHLAVSKGKTRITTSIVAKSPCLIDAPGGENQRTPLHLAVEGRQKDLVALLIEKGASVDIPDHNGVTPLHIACQSVCLYCAELLLRNGADATKRSADGQTCLSIVKKASHKLAAIALSECDRFQQVVEVIQHHKLIVDDKCDVTLLVACLLCQHGCPIDPGFDPRWRNCFMDCSKLTRNLNAENNGTSDGGADEKIQSLQDQVKQLNEKLDEALCSICLDDVRNIVFLPCKHGSCEKCSKRLSCCHICRKTIDDKMSFF